MNEPPESAAERHRRIAAGFTAVVVGAPPGRWDDPAPVADWSARDVVRHLVEWSRGFLESGAQLTLPAVPSVHADPGAAWSGHAAWIQSLVDEPGDRVHQNRHTGETPLAEAIDRFYTTDVLMHTWDLAEATGQPHGLDPEECAGLLVRMEPLDEMLRTSGQYGAAVPVPDDADPVTRLMGFIGRDPSWRA